jgi:hypothetical protein
VASPPGPTLNVLLGILRLARFDPSGLAQFTSSRPAFLSSLAPLLAFPLVGGLLWFLTGGGAEAVTELLATLCALLAPAVLSHLFAAAWQREADWLRYGVAFNWCQWAIPFAAALLLLVLAGLMTIGLPAQYAGTVAVIGLVLYALSLHWFLACHGLRLSGLRAAVLVIGVNLGTAALILVPRLLAFAVGGLQDL